MPYGGLWSLAKRTMTASWDCAGQIPFSMLANEPSMVRASPPNAERRVVELSESSLPCRPGYGPLMPPQDGIWHISSGDGIVPWNNPPPPCTTKFRFVPSAQEKPARGSKFFIGLLMAALGQ